MTITAGVNGDVRGRRNDRKVVLPIDSGQAVSIGDLVYYNTDDVRAADQQADQLTEPDNQRVFASLFVGVSETRKRTTDTQIASILVDIDPYKEFEFPCASETHEVGDLLGAAEQSNGTQLENAKLKKVTSLALAIARCVKQDTAATTLVRCRFIKGLLQGNPELSNVTLQSAVAQSAAVTANGVATTFSTGSKTIDGSALKAGDILRIRAAGVIGTATGAETVTVQLLVGTEVVATTGAVDPVSGDVFFLDADVTVRTAGAAGVLQSRGVVGLGTAGTVTAKPFCGQAVSEDISSTALAITCKVTNSSTGESVTLEGFSVEIIRA